MCTLGVSPASDEGVVHEDGRVVAEHEDGKTNVRVIRGDGDPMGDEQGMWEERLGELDSLNSSLAAMFTTVLFIPM